MEWYAAKCIFKHHPDSTNALKALYEERVVLFQAQNFDDAVNQAEAEAAEYCADSGRCAYVGYVDIYHLPEDHVGHRVEVYSLMRESSLSADEYLNRFYDTGNERTQSFDNG